MARNRVRSSVSSQPITASRPELGNTVPSFSHIRLGEGGCHRPKKTSTTPSSRLRVYSLEPRASIGFLVGYVSTNIYRIWIPHKKKVISARDVLFDEESFFDGKRIPFTDELIRELDEAIQVIEVQQDPDPDPIEEDEPLPEGVGEEIGNQADQEDEDIMDLEEEETTLEVEDKAGTAYQTPPASVFLANSSNLPVKSEGVDEPNLPTEETRYEFPDLPDSFQIEPAILDELKRQQNERFFDFEQRRTRSKLNSAFIAGARIHKRELPQAPRSYRELKDHPLRAQFEEDMRKHLREHEEVFKSWKERDRSEAKGHQILGCHWVFVYKMDKHGRLQRCKSRLVVRGDQQAECDLPTRATTLATTSLRVLLAIIAKFDLETLQLDAVNAFVHANLDEIVYMRLPPGFEKEGKVLLLNKALYGLRRSPLLWQTMFTEKLREQGFREVPQEPCCVVRHGIVCFFFVDDIVFAFRKKHEAEVKQTVKGLQKEITIKEMGNLRWFLGIHIIRDRKTRRLWISQKACIEKIVNRFSPDLSRPPATPMEETELLPLDPDQEVDVRGRELYQQKVGSILFAAISTRPDIAFAASRLARFNQRPGKVHQQAADRVLKYLWHTRNLCLKYGGQSSEATSFLCSSDASFADNSIDRKSSQGYLMTLFGGPVAWRANKQDTVTTSSTEAELLAVTQTAKEAIYLSRLFKALSLELKQPLKLQCDNRQTIRLLVEEAMKLQTKLRHVDIHSHWLRQEVQRKVVHIDWTPTAEMAADSLTKALGRTKFTDFRRMTGLEDLEMRLLMIEKRDELDELRKQQEGSQTLVLMRGPVFDA